MLTLTFDLPSGRRSIDLVLPRVTIGRGLSNTVAIDEPDFAQVHVVLECVSGDWSFRARGAGGYAVSLNGERMKKGPLASGDVLTLASIDFWVGESAPLSAEEQLMIQQLQDGRPGPRLVFADWLDGRGDSAHADYLRLELELERCQAHEREPLLERMRALDVSVRSRALASRGRIEGCAATACQGEWARLELMAPARVRACGQCGMAVTFCDTVGEARVLAGERHERVIVEITRPREPGDLDWPLLVLG